MATVELVYDRDCPNVAETRAQLLRAFAQVELPPNWCEWRNGAADSPDHVRGYGSPTILVDGRDVAPVEPNGGAACRLYEQPDGSMRGVPSVAVIAAALAETASQTRSLPTR